MSIRSRHGFSTLAAGEGVPPRNVATPDAPHIFSYGINSAIARDLG